ncbi:MAG: pitrilysin family protein [Bacteroidales bacterium]|nr:pitrilysin family protein [Bacteroidales bacterium]
MIEVNKYTLQNGLKLLHHEDKSTEMVAVNILYNVGSRNENPNQTGFAHLFEHLMFGGSKNIPDFDTPLQEAGGENNAWTSEDITNYYEVVPKENIEIALWLESDRMLSLNFDKKSLDVQKQVVIEEFKQRNLNQPYGDIPLILRPVAYTVHPYMWPTIGKEISHIENARLSDVEEFFFSHYAPNNAILAVAGNISFEETKKIVEKWFGDIPYRQLKQREIPVEPIQTEERFIEVYKNVPIDAITKAYHIGGRLDSEYHCYDILSDILSNGRSARLNQHLIMEKKLFSEVNAYISGSIDPGLFYLTGKPAPGISLEQADKALQEEVEILKNELVSEYELRKLVNKFESNDVFSNINYLNKATNLAYFELLSKAEDINTEVEKYYALTPEKLRDTAKKIFRKENCTTLYYRAAKK